MLNTIKILLGIDISNTEYDDLLTILIQQATEEAITYTHNEDLEILNPIITKMVIYNFNMRDNVGVESESYSGNSFSYSTDYPEPIIRSLKRVRKVIVL